MAGAKIEKDVFGTLPDGRSVERIVLRGESGFEARIITHGAVIQALIAPDARGGYDDVVLGHDAFAGYLAERKFFGATVGRYANRIANGQFSLDGETVQLPVNNGPNALHGGLDGFDRKLWEIAEIDDGSESAVTLTYTSPHGEENYPGRLDVRLTYRVTGPSELSLTMEARTDRPTIVNLTNHSFFNLEGATSGTPVLDHKLTVAAEHFLAIDPTAIPLPEPPRSVAGTPFDFRDAQPVGARIRESDRQLQNGKGYDHTYCLPSAATANLRSRRGWRRRARGGSWSCSPISPAFRSIPATISTARSRARAASCIGSRTRCAWSRTCGPIHQTGRIFQARASIQAGSIAIIPSIALR
ncbi:aldose 1-epimerase [Bradyrhizobium sp. LB7.1]